MDYPRYTNGKLDFRHRGEYDPRSKTAYIYLANIAAEAESYFGRDNVPEDALIHIIESTIIHESLHHVVISSGPAANAREHRAIYRLLWASGYRHYP